jgi:uncharacterized membrane protein YfcA
MWLVLLGGGFLIGGAGDAKAAAASSRVFLQWTFVLYLMALGAIVVAQPRRQQVESADAPAAPPVSRAALVAVGVFAGFWSGFLGIGGGLAITVGLSGWLKVPQPVAQMISLALLVISLTIPTAWVYWREGRIVSGTVLIASCSASSPGRTSAHGWRIDRTTRLCVVRCSCSLC